MAGRVYLVGAGPGDPRLITVRGQQLLARADVVVFDSGCSPELVDAAPEKAERICVGRWPDSVALRQPEIQALLVDRARRGLCVVRLKNGDPFLFARGGEECRALAEAGLCFEVVPGIPAALAAAEYAGVPLTERDVASQLVVAMAQRSTRPLLPPLPAAGAGASLAIYLDPRALSEVVAELLGAGLPASTPAALVQRASWGTQQTFAAPLGELAERARGAKPPALLLVGKAVAESGRLAWAERRPLHGVGVVLTRARRACQPMADLLAELGAQVVVLPCLETAEPETFAALDDAVARVESFDWVVFASAQAVEVFHGRLWRAGRDWRALRDARIAVVGAATAEALQRHGIRADLAPEQAHGEALARALIARGVSGARVLVPRAAEGREELLQLLADHGAAVEAVAAYRTVVPEADPGPLRELRASGRLRAVVFMSPSALRGFEAHLGRDEALEVLRESTAVVVGPTTEAAVQAFGAKAILRSAAASGEAVVDAIVRGLGSQTACVSGRSS